MIEFDADKHLFRLNGEEVPHVNQILEDERWRDTRWYTREARDRGQYIHQATALLDAELLDWGSLEPWAVPYVEQWEKAKRELDVRITSIERIVHKGNLWAGILDRTAVWERAATVIDLKTGDPVRADKLQILGYESTYRERRRVLLVYLKPDRYRAVELEAEEAEIYRMAWHQIVSLWWFRRRNGK